MKTRQQNIEHPSPEFAITAILAESPVLSEAMPQILRVLCEEFDWDLAEAWVVIPDSRFIELRIIWHTPSFRAAAEWAAVHRGISAHPGHGLIGRAWEQCKYQWSDHLGADPRFSRSALASKLGLVTACAVPVMVDSTVGGVIALFSRKSRTAEDANMEELLALAQQTSPLLKTHSAVSRGERFIADLVGSVHDILGIFRLDGTIEYESPAVEEVLGYRIEELIARSVFDYIHPDDFPAMLDVFHKGLAQPGTAHQVELRARHRSGSWVWLECRGSVERYGSDMVVVVVSRDLTHRADLTEGLVARRAASTRSRPSLPSLTAGELRVVRLVSRGMSNREIAQALSLSPHTVKEYVSKVSRKLGARNRAQIAAMATELEIT